MVLGGVMLEAIQFVRCPFYSLKVYPLENRYTQPALFMKSKDEPPYFFNFMWLSDFR